MEELQDVFGTRLKRFMQEKNMTQRKLAKATGLTDVTISRYTNGTRLPGADELLKLSNALSVSAFGYIWSCNGCIVLCSLYFYNHVLSKIVKRFYRIY